MYGTCNARHDVSSSLESLKTLSNPNHLRKTSYVPLLNSTKTCQSPQQHAINTPIFLPPPPESIDKGWGTMHVVQPGETLETIAELYRTTPLCIRRDNRQYFPSGDRGSMMAGQLLHIRQINQGQPAGQTGTMLGVISDQKYKMHRVSKNDSIESICANHDISLSRLMQLNPRHFLNSARASLSSGTDLIVPDHEATKMAYMHRHISEVTLTKQIHTVENGETPASISAQYQMNLDELRELNRSYFPKGCRGQIWAGCKLVVKRLNHTE